MAMSGVSVADECVTALNDLRHKKSRYVIMHIVDQKSIAVKTIGERGANFDQFIEAIDKNVPCYAAFDFEYTTNDGPRDKLILISWNPDSGAPRTKMLYSSSRDALVPLTQGFQGIQANDASGLDFEEISRKVKSNR
ncbi:cofilin/actin depolymerizing factor, putative [Trypanosoma equiperdum]|uniref:Cofilin/actin depolymerizing factor, putative n=3 Tax=Trypanozoon TaxID=39700 RepID=Q580V7_TRYB2|nr:cofilin/actin depolymerizing factor, putative [Trypanosoma brucei gambiense DAL972]XP_844108.1 cofilin/actin depolymerizing factor, putative [Trypanosoma brucei brucei TREU927]AAX81027.1 cofilin/actin depolymerizing factor, putative [Trypanosoma brucei]SCU64816.1 cofilin/actin depolymerizing factor, putative [Trypanosoma equiperdum]AAZ10549.1 cofilin/actin depolymerizing factor, putative [Trypanosoma brucei brucei TREU927]CBH10242.1 cofilin/actin depolymerizing factor, putative [Trypanosoma|eukprot:XP_011772532.1 cofilin/actin depolymerizing factor, putative [Trypanosoma brucei gambiense DAL972]